VNDDRKIPWKRIAVEAVAIVASILHAFAIDASWEDRQANTKRQDLIHGLTSDFESLVERADTAFTLADDVVARNQELLELLASGGGTDLEDLKLLLSSFFESTGRLQTSLPILDTALGAEGLGSINDSSFLRAVRDFQDQRENYDRILRLSAEIFYRDLGPYYRQRFGTIAVLRGEYSSFSGTSYSYPAEFALTADEIIEEFRKPELFGRLEHRFNTNRNIRLFISNIRETARSVLQALKELD
jgi:hypothetical protein